MASWAELRRADQGKGGRPPPPFLLPATVAANQEAGTRPPAQPPATPKRQFSREKNQSSWQRRGQRWPSGHSGYHVGPRGIRATHAAPSPSPAGSSAQAGEWITAAREVSCRAGPGASPGQAHWVLRARGLCRTFLRGPGRAASMGALMPARGLPCTRSRDPNALPTPHPVHWLGRGRAASCGAGRGSRGQGGGGPGEPPGRMSVSAPARGAPRDSIVAPEPDFARPEFPGCVRTNRERSGRGDRVRRSQ